MCRVRRLIINGVSRTKIHRRTPPAASCASAANWRSTAPVGPARDIGEWPLGCAERPSTKRTDRETSLRFTKPLLVSVLAQAVSRPVARVR